MNWTFVDSGEQTGAFNMELDESNALALLKKEGPGVVRLYGWRPWAISLGHHQKRDDIDVTRAAADGIDVVRRPTGGRAILHAEELTYCVVMPAGRRSVLQVYNDISAALVTGLRQYGIHVSLQKSQPNFSAHYRQASSIPCFTASARYEIEWQGRKLVGSAQRRFSEEGRDVVLQHGSILCGPAHKRLADYLRVDDPSVLATVRRELEEKTVDLTEISGSAVDILRLRESLRTGFIKEWGIQFQGHPDLV
jgi:lipoyl(octanoyl) transferase